MHWSRLGVYTAVSSIGFCATWLICARHDAYAASPKDSTTSIARHDMTGVISAYLELNNTEGARVDFKGTISNLRTSTTTVSIQTEIVRDDGKEMISVSNPAIVEIGGEGNYDFERSTPTSLPDGFYVLRLTLASFNDAEHEEVRFVEKYFAIEEAKAFGLTFEEWFTGSRANVGTLEEG